MVSLAASLPCSLDGMVANVRQLCPHERIEFFERLLRDCSFMEIRFIASLVENILSANYASLGSLEDELPLLLGNSEKMLSFGDKLHLDDQRRQLIVILCLLKSRERLEVTKLIADIFQKLPDAVRKMNSSSSLTVLAAHEILLLFSLAMCHPAFEFSQKYNFYTALQSVVDLLQPALGDGDKESCILLKSSCNDLVSSNVTSCDEKVDSSKAFKITPDEDIAFIQVDIPVTSSPNGTHVTNGLKSVTVKTEKLVNVFAEKCVLQPSNPKTDPNAVLLKAKDGSRESVLHSALNAIVSDGGLPKLLEIFPQDAKAQLAEERLRRVTAKQETHEVPHSSSPESDFIINENNSPDNTSGLALTSGSSASSLRGSFDKKSKVDLSRSTGMSSESSGVGVNLSNSGDTRSSDYTQGRDHSGRKLAPSAPPSLAFGSSLSADDSPSSASSSSDWNGGSISSKNVLNKYPRSDDASSTSSAEACFTKQPMASNSASDTTITGENTVSAMKTNSRQPPYDYLHPLQMSVPPTDPKAFALYLQYAQAYQATIFGMHPSAGHLMWPNPHMLEPLPHHAPHSPFLIPYPISQQQQQLQLEQHALCNRSAPPARMAQGPPVQSSTPTPNNRSESMNTVGNGDSSEKVASSSNDTAVQAAAAILVSTSNSAGSNGQHSDISAEQPKAAQKDENVQSLSQPEPSTNDALSPSSSSSASSSGTANAGPNGHSVPNSQSSSAHQTSARPNIGSAPFGHHQLPTHPLQIASTGPLGMSLPNLFTPLHLVPCNQTSQVAANQQSGHGSRRGSIASESGYPAVDPSQISYFLYPPVLPNPSAHLQHPSTTASSSSSSFITQRNNMAPLPPFTNPPPSMNGLYQGPANAPQRKPPASMPTSLSQVTVHSVSPAQLFSIPPPPLPVTVSQKSAANTSTTSSNPITAAPHGNVGPVPVPFIALSNRDLQHALAFPAAFMAGPHVDSFSPPPAPVSPNSSVNANNNGNISASGIGFRGNADSMRGQPQFSGHNTNVNASRRGITGFTNVHYHQRIGQQANPLGHLHQSQSVGALSRPSANATRGVTVNCFRCGEPGHVQTQCQQANVRRRTPYSGREFQINVAPVSNNSSNGASQDLRVPLSHFVQRQQQSISGDVAKAAQQPSTGPIGKPDVDTVLPSVVVTTDSPAVANPVAVV